MLAVNHTVGALMIQQICHHNFAMMDARGGLHPLLSKHMPDVRKGILDATGILLRLEAAASPPAVSKAEAGTDSATTPADPAPADISAIVLSLANEQEG